VPRAPRPAPPPSRAPPRGVGPVGVRVALQNRAALCPAWTRLLGPVVGLTAEVGATVSAGAVLCEVNGINGIKEPT
jgi:hypothetical protein